MFIQTEPTPNPATLVFARSSGAGQRPARHARPGRCRPARRRAAVRDCGRLRRVFRRGLHRGYQDRWRMAATQAGDPGAIMEHFMSGAPIVNSTGDGAPLDNDEFFEAKDSETVATIKELIEARVRPAVANDGGDITFRGFKDGVVYLDMKGACSGCLVVDGDTPPRHPEPLAPLPARRGRGQADGLVDDRRRQLAPRMAADSIGRRPLLNRHSQLDDARPRHRYRARTARPPCSTPGTAVLSPARRSSCRAAMPKRSCRS